MNGESARSFVNYHHSMLYNPVSRLPTLLHGFLISAPAGTATATISTHQTPFKQSSPKTLLPLLIHGISNSKAKKTSSSGWAAPCAFSNNVFRHPTPGEAHILWHPAREQLVSAVWVRLSCGSSCRSHVCKRSCAVRCSFTADRSQ